MINIHDIEDKYASEFDVLNDSDEVLQFRHAFTLLTPYERRIMLLYAELGTYRNVAKVLGVSTTPVHKIINGVKSKLNKVIDKTKLEY